MPAKTILDLFLPFVRLSVDLPPRSPDISRPLADLPRLKRSARSAARVAIVHRATLEKLSVSKVENENLASGRIFLSGRYRLGRMQECI